MSERKLRLITAALLALPMLIAAGVPQGSAPRNALIGTWECDPSKSTFNGAMPYRGATSRFAAVGEHTHVTVDIIEANGVALHFEYRDAEDGAFVPVVGNPFYDNESTVWLDKHTARRTERRGEKVTGTTTMTVAPDGQSYVARASRTRPDGKLYTSVIHWDRSGS
jgi:hypothetical protein